MINRRQESHPKEKVDYSKIRVGLKDLEDAVLNLGDTKRIGGKYGNKEYILTCIRDNKIEDLASASNFFYRINGIYSSLCRYLAYLYKYDWMVTPYINNDSKPKSEKIISEFYKILKTFDDFSIKQFCGNIALKVVVNGCYYGYLLTENDKLAVQELPANYCRSRFSVGNKPTVEFNMKYFDDAFKDAGQRMRVLQLFPKEFKKGYLLYKQGKLVPDFQGDTAGWYLLDVDRAFKFNINGQDFPVLIPVIPALIDLDDVEDLEKRKIHQKLLKIIIQQLPLDKNGESIFDLDELIEFHNNAKAMLSKAIGVNVLTTFADVKVADTSDPSTTAAVDDLAKIERNVYNAAGISQNQFNTDGNIALEKSTLNDEALMNNLILQYQLFFNSVLDLLYNKNEKKYYFKIQILNTTINNYKDLAKMYTDQTKIGYSKMLSQIALGQSQSSILATNYFENDLLDLVNLFIPPLSSSTMGAKTLSEINSDDKGGRPEKEDDQKSEKTLKNRESLN